LMLISKVDTQRYNDAFNSLSYNTHAAINNWILMITGSELMYFRVNPMKAINKLNGKVSWLNQLKEWWTF
jgi:hypothetical protein